MVSIFQQLDDIIYSNKRAEVKVAAFQDLITRLSIKSEDEFIEARDMEGSLVLMNYQEEYNVITNTLFTYMLAQQIPNSKWPTLQEDFERKIQAGWSYKNWHENRPKLYELIDKIPKQKRAINQISDHGGYEEELTEQDICRIQSRFQRRDFRTKSAPNSRSNSQARENYSTRNRFASNDRNNTREPKSYTERKEANDKAEKSKANLCIHCTNHNDRRVAIYHPPHSGFGGHGSHCIYDVNGEFKSQKARGLIQEIFESNVSHFVSDREISALEEEYQAFDEEDSRENL